MRLTSGFFVAALIRRAEVEGAFAVLRRRGTEEAGAVFVKVDRLDGRATLYAPAAQSDYGATRPEDRLFRRVVEGTPGDCEERIARELRFDADLWLVEIEDREGRSFLEEA
jgi:hypothetical protein